MSKRDLVRFLRPQGFGQGAHVFCLMAMHVSQARRSLLGEELSKCSPVLKGKVLLLKDLALLGSMPRIDKPPFRFRLYVTAHRCIKLAQLPHLAV